MGSMPLGRQHVLWLLVNPAQGDAMLSLYAQRPRGAVLRVGLWAVVSGRISGCASWRVQAVSGREGRCGWSRLARIRRFDVLSTNIRQILALSTTRFLDKVMAIRNIIPETQHRLFRCSGILSMIDHPRATVQTYASCLSRKGKPCSLWKLRMHRHCTVPSHLGQID